MPPSRRQLLVVANAVAWRGLLAGCATTDPAAPETDPSQSTTEHRTETQSPPSTTPDDVSLSPMRAVTYGNTGFGANLLRAVAIGGENRLVSPYSVGVALAMTYAGARGDTRSQMQSTLHYPFDGPELHRAFQTLTDRLVTSDDGSTASPSSPTPDAGRSDAPLQVVDANALWGQAGFPWRAAFLSLVERYYAAGLHQLDFAQDPAAARQTINAWVARVTNEEITDLLPPDSIARETRLVLTNGVYFRGLWKHPFPPSNTVPRPFTAVDGSETAIPMMTNDSKAFPYAEVDGHQIVELPYRGGAYGMVIVLPPAGGYESVEASLTAERLWAWCDQLERRAGTLTVPKFSFDSSVELGAVLAELGMPAAFDQAQADLSGMAEAGAGDALFIDEVYHQTVIDVDEKGTEAAAATGVVIPVSKTTSDNPFEMVVDRPFLFLIRERRTGAVLFLGRLVDATSARSGQ